jgi:hypothetical protein
VAPHRPECICKHFIIAAFLSGATTNNWLQAEMEVMMKSHLDVMLEESSARLNGDWPLMTLCMIRSTSKFSKWLANLDKPARRKGLICLRK